MNSRFSSGFTCSLIVLRFVLAAWIGAAVLYVVTSIAEQVFPEFDGRIRDQLATIRFPLYYRFGFACHLAAATAGLIVWRLAPESRRRTFLIVLLLILLSGIGILVDYRWVYTPLQNLIIPPGQPHTAEFEVLHQRSMHINEAHLMCIAFAGILSMLPVGQPTEKSSDSES
ncbi:MAG: hypothetical protein R3C49_07530 [Planctomycetaceae bacterium]